MGSTKEFFKEKKEWSKIKDEILLCYLKPYFSKIKNTQKRILYIDGFAGKGFFDDGSKGSPLIAYDIVNETIDIEKVDFVFIENYYANDLKNNTATLSNVKIIDGNYEDNICNIINSSYNKNVFLYIDPFGIKSMNFSYLKSFNNATLNTLEILMNLNSFGFIREGCRLFGTKLDDVESDYEDSIKDEDFSKNNSIEKMNVIAGGDYWQKIIQDKKNGKINGYEAEKRFVIEYCEKLNTDCNFKHVINIPIRLSYGSPPKYRLVFCTNNDGALRLMNNNMWKRFQQLKDIQNKNLPTLFRENLENEFIDDEVIIENLLSIIKNKPKISYNDLIINYIKMFGIMGEPVINNFLKTMERQNLINIIRIPEITPSGKKSTFISSDKNQQSFFEVK